jgi:hypothetical protein
VDVVAVGEVHLLALVDAVQVAVDRGRVAALTEDSYHVNETIYKKQQEQQQR